jgi:alpha-L-rhamnosidase
MGGSIQYRYDISRLYAKQVNDMRTAQHANGMVPTIAPQYVTFSPDFIDTPEWGSAFVIIPWNLYEWYGDLAPLRDNYERMKRYVDYLGSRPITISSPTAWAIGTTSVPTVPVMRS